MTHSLTKCSNDYKMNGDFIFVCIVAYRILFLVDIDIYFFPRIVSHMVRWLRSIWFSVCKQMTWIKMNLIQIGSKRQKGEQWKTYEFSNQHRNYET